MPSGSDGQLHMNELRGAFLLQEGSVLCVQDVHTKVPAVSLYGDKGWSSCAQARKMLDSAMQPGAAQKALSMQVESFWQRHGNKVLGLGAVFLLYVLWCAAICHTIASDKGSAWLEHKVLIS